MAHNEPPHQDLRCLQIQLFSSLVVKELSDVMVPGRAEELMPKSCIADFSVLELRNLCGCVVLQVVQC